MSELSSKIENLYKELSQSINSENIEKSIDVLDKYSSDKFFSGIKPSLIIYPDKASEVSTILKLCNKFSIPVTPKSSKVSLHGKSLLSTPGVIIDLSKMNKIVNIDFENKSAIIQPGVDYKQLIEALEGKPLMPIIPLAPLNGRSIIAEYLEYVPLTIPKYEYSEPILSMEFAFSDGTLFATGSKIFTSRFSEGVSPYNIGLNLNMLFHGAQGCFGVVTQARIKLAPRPVKNECLIFKFNNLKDALNIVHKIQFYNIGNECFILDNNLSSKLFGKNFGEYIVFITISGYSIHPELRIKAEKDQIKKLIQEKAEVVNELLPIIRKPTSQIRNQFVEISCLITKQNLSNFKFDFANEGVYIQPYQRGTSYHLQIFIKSIKEIESISNKILKAGGYFLSPNNYQLRIFDENTRVLLKELKKFFDPKLILNRGKLCF
ncbi:MAG: FAD-binding oxidoreductase [Promethearchaeia archaeon]